MDEKDGGLAFGGMVTEDQGIAGNVHSWKKGMSQRDWFAGQAEASGLCPINVFEFKGSAEWCYKRADAMLAERERGGGA